MKYKVIGQEIEPRSSVEINGLRRFAGEVLDESEFKPASGIIVVTEFPDGTKTEEPEMGELESLLKTGHLEPVGE